MSGVDDTTLKTGADGRPNKAISHGVGMARRPSRMSATARARRCDAASSTMRAFIASSSGCPDWMLIDSDLSRSRSRAFAAASGIHLPSPLALLKARAMRSDDSLGIDMVKPSDADANIFKPILKPERRHP